jgi:hypothetical protein
MAQVDKSSLHDFATGEKVTESMLDQNFEVLRVSYNDIDKKLADLGMTGFAPMTFNDLTQNTFNQLKLGYVANITNPLDTRITSLETNGLPSGKMITVFVEDYGAKGDGVTDDKTAIQNAINAAYDNKATFLVFKEGKTYGVSDQISWNGNPGTNGLNTGLIVIANGSTIKLLQHTTTGGVIGIGRGAYTGERDTSEKTGNILWVGGTIDINGITGENGFGVTRANNVKIMNAIVKNTAYDDSIQGGRGFSVHPLSTNISFDNCYAYKVGDAFHVAAVPDVRSDINGIDILPVIGVSKATQAVVTLDISQNANPFIVGDKVYIYNLNGMTELNPSYTTSEKYYTVQAITANTVTLDVNTTTFSTYTSGGNLVRANLLGYRDNGITITGGYAVECMAALTVETENRAKSLAPIYTPVNVNGLDAVNCGRTGGLDGIVNGSNATGVKVRGLNIYNDSSHPVSDVIRGSFQRGTIEAIIDVDTCTSIINAAPLTRVNSLGESQFPYSYLTDMNFDLKVKVKTVSNALLTSTDLAGSSFDYTWRNYVKLFLIGYEGTYGIPIKDSYFTNNRNFIEIFDSYNGRTVRGRADHDFTSFSNGTLPAGNVDFGVKVIRGGANTKPELILDASSGSNNISRISAYLDDALRGSFDYRHGNDRWYMNIAGADKWQFTATNIMPISDNTQDFGSAGLRMRNMYIGGYITVGNVSSLPTASSTYRGQVILVLGNGTSTADTFYICLQSATGTYSWKSIMVG